ncbi:TIGR04013 family B12-binding domain/radical SAM domain-containing protein [Methanoregula sp.]|uniref:TIGR04013 family B12-binding domain/radical SAM domain-containing protein n=1 Tax=Methanoregula sp. TaxID=2052170 RepID=UPI003BB1AFB6
MQANWREIPAARNSFAVLSAACETTGWHLRPVAQPESDITCYSLNSINEVRYRDEIANAECITVVGGPHATACWQEVATNADYVIVGEGEYTLPSLLASLEAGGDGRIPGVATVDWYEPVKSSVRLDAFPPFSEVKGYVEISRGCPFTCGYCQTPQMFGHCMRHRSIDGIARYANRYGQARFVTPNAFAYGSDGVHPRFDKIEHLLRNLSHEIFFGTFPSEVRPEFICRESLALISDYCTNTRLHFGAQSGSDAVLARLRRGHTVAEAIRAAELCHDAGIIPVVDFIVGFPFETDEDQRETITAMQEVARNGRIHIHRFIPLPGTPLAGARARSLLSETEKVCGDLALGGKLTGSWNEPEIRFFRRRLK